VPLVRPKRLKSRWKNKYEPGRLAAKGKPGLGCGALDPVAREGIPRREGTPREFESRPGYHFFIFRSTLISDTDRSVKKRVSFQDFSAISLCLGVPFFTFSAR